MQSQSPARTQLLVAPCRVGRRPPAARISTWIMSSCTRVAVCTISTTAAKQIDSGPNTQVDAMKAAAATAGCACRRPLAGILQISVIVLTLDAASRPNSCSMAARSSRSEIEKFSPRRYRQCMPKFQFPCSSLPCRHGSPGKCAQPQNLVGPKIIVELQFPHPVFLPRKRAMMLCSSSRSLLDTLTVSPWMLAWAFVF